MSKNQKHIDKSKLSLLKKVMNILIPEVDDLPSAGLLITDEKILELLYKYNKYFSSFNKFINAIRLDLNCRASGGFESLDYENKEIVLKELEQNIPEIFNNILEMTLLAYYSNNKVLDRIKWKRKTLQPEGWKLEKFNPKILDKIKLREPFWKEI